MYLEPEKLAGVGVETDDEIVLYTPGGVSRHHLLVDTRHHALPVLQGTPHS